MTIIVKIISIEGFRVEHFETDSLVCRASPLDICLQILCELQQVLMVM